MLEIKQSACIVAFCCIAAAQAQPQLTGLQPPGSYTPLSSSEKLRYSFGHMMQPYDLLQFGLGSGLAQWRNSPHEWGQGWDAYGTRYASRIGQALVDRTVTLGIQAFDGEDPRRIRSSRSGVWPRALDAVKYTFVAQRDDGTRGFAYSRVIGNYAGGLISRTWHPNRVQTFGNGLWAGTTSTGIEAGMNVLTEFLPDILRKLRLR